MNALPAGWAPNTFYFYDEDMAKPDAMGDSIAKIVLERFRAARQFKHNNHVYQGKSTTHLLRLADYAREKRFMPEQVDALMGTFGFCPTRYYGLSAAKTKAISDWKSELVAGDPGALVKIVPTPNPRLTKSSIENIKEQVKQEIIKRMMEAGTGDPNVLMSVENGRLHETVKEFLDGKAEALRQIEQAKIVSASMSAADKMQLAVRDLVIEGDFRESYAMFSDNQIGYGIGILRFPFWQRRIVYADTQNGTSQARRVWRTLPTFRAVSPWNFFPMADGRTVQDNTGNSEYYEISKTGLVGLVADSRYNRKAIEEILENYAFKSRTWLFPEASNTESETGEKSTYWGPEEIVAVVYHEGLVTGYDLHEYGLTGYDDTELYTIHAEICCGRAIRVEVVDPLKVLSRSFATTKFEDLGPGIWNTVGVPAILHDTQERVNTIFYCLENNLDWSLRPPLQTNSEALKNPHEARAISPGGKYEISDMIGQGSSPDPIRVIRGPSAQYQIVWPIIRQMIQQADAECGVPDLADMSTFGRGSLGELSARVSQAVRRVRSAAFSEDRSMKSVWQSLFDYALKENPELVENLDLDMNYIGVIGMLAAETERKMKVERLGLVMQGVQSGVTPPEVAQFAYQDLYKDLGIPTEALGMSDPLTDQAIALAMAAGTPPAAAGGSNLAGAPALDGRSGAMGSIPTAIAAPNGAGSPIPAM